MTVGSCTSTTTAMLIATYARRHKPAGEAAARRRGQQRTPIRSSSPPRPSASSASVIRKVDSSGNVSFAGTNYRVGNTFRRRQVQVAVVADTVEISIGEELIRTHPIRHDPTRGHGALAIRGGRPQDQRHLNLTNRVTQLPEPLRHTATGP